MTLVIAPNPIIGAEKALLIAKTARVGGATIAEVTETPDIMTRAEMSAAAPTNLTQPVRLMAWRLHSRGAPSGRLFAPGR
jgi:fumarate hydratase class II